MEYLARYIDFYAKKGDINKKRHELIQYITERIRDNVNPLDHNGLMYRSIAALEVFDIPYMQNNRETYIEDAVNFNIECIESLSDDEILSLHSSMKMCINGTLMARDVGDEILQPMEFLFIKVPTGHQLIFRQAYYRG